MAKKILVVAALLLIALSKTAIAADSNEHISKGAQNVIVTLDAIGVNNKKVKDYIATIDNNVDHGYLNLSEKKALGGTFSLRYQLNALPTAKQLEFRYTPDNSHIQATMRTNSATIGYHLNF